MTTVNSIYNIVIPTFYLHVFVESTLLNYAKPSRKWTFQRFARVAVKKERNAQMNDLTLSRIRNQSLILSPRRQRATE